MSVSDGTTTSPHAEPADSSWRADLSRALTIVSLLLLGMFFVVRPVAYQLTPYSAEAAFAGVLVVLIGLCVWGATLTTAPRLAAVLPNRLAPALLFFLGIVALGLMRSPNLGTGVARAGEAATYALLLIACFLLVRAVRSIAIVLCACLVAMGVTEAVIGIWQKFIELPRLREAVRSGRELLPTALLTQQGQERLFSDEIYATFGNANSFAAFLLITILVQVGLWLASRARRTAPGKLFGSVDVLHCLVLSVQVYALILSGSKGAWLAFLIGVWFLVSLVLSSTPGRKRVFRGLTMVGLVTLVVMLALATSGVFGERPFGASMAERFAYWQSAAAMVRDQPLLGVGLGGFGDAYSLYKMPLGTEAREAHNDWLQLWAELGLFGPIAWGLLWFTILRRRGSGGFGSPDNAEVVDTPLPRRFFPMALAGGVLAFLAIYVAFEGLNAPDLWFLLAGESDAPGVTAGAIMALITPAFFAVAYWGLMHGMQGCVATDKSVATSTPLTKVEAGVRAAIGVILVHQLVDFDLTAPAVMSAIFVLGGLLMAISGPTRGEPDSSATVPSRTALLPLLLTPVLSIVVFPIAVVVPLFSGLSRKSAEISEDALRDLVSRGADVARDAESSRRLRREISTLREHSVREREQAFRWASFDGRAAANLAIAYSALRQSGRESWPPLVDHASPVPLEKLILERWEEAARLCPLWVGAPLQAGNEQLVLGLESLGLSERDRAMARFRAAEKAYRRGTELYPLAPMLRLSTGDALMLQGRVERAASEYRDAWEIDKRILDRNARLSAIFEDRLPGCLPRHGRNDEIFKEVARDLDGRKPSDPSFPWLQLRKLVGTAAVRLQAYQSRSKAMARASDMGLLDACKDLSAALPNDVHAAMFDAAATSLLLADQKAEIKDAWQRASQMRETERMRGAVAPELVFEELRWRAKKSSREWGRIRKSFSTGPASKQKSEE